MVNEVEYSALPLAYIYIYIYVNNSWATDKYSFLLTDYIWNRT